MKIVPTRLAVSLIAAAIALPAFAQNVAIVNGTAIPQSRADLLVTEQKSQGAPDSEQLRAAVKEELIRRELLSQEARKKSLDKSAAVQAQMDMARQAVEGVEGLGVCALEGEMPVPSYSHSTLVRLAELFPGTRHVFVLGSSDLLTLPDWHRGLELPLLADMAVVDRLGLGLDEVDRFLATHWRWSEEGTGLRRIAGGRLVAFVPMARLDISASMVREKFCVGREVRGLVPEAVRGRMLAAPRQFSDCWNTSI